jgi:hypothetical protein
MYTKDPSIGNLAATGGKIFLNCSTDLPVLDFRFGRIVCEWDEELLRHSVVLSSLREIQPLIEGRALTRS